MIYVIENSEKEKMWVEWASELICRKGAYAFFVNADRMNEKVEGKIREGECPVVLYATGKWGSLSDEKKKLVFPLLSLRNVGTMPGYPFSLFELHAVYRALEGKEAVDNRFVVAAIRGSAILTLRYALEKVASEEEKRNKICSVEEALNIRIRESEIRAEINEVASNISPVAPPILDTIVSGVFCTAEDALFTYDGKVNGEAVKKLHELEKKRHVVLWTNGDVDEARAALHGAGIRNRNGKDYSVISKRHYAGRKVAFVIDRLADLSTFEKTYRIFPQEYTRIKSGA